MKQNQNNNSKAATPAKSKTKKIMLIGFGLAGAGILSYFGWQYWKKHKTESDGSAEDAPDFSAKNEYAPPPPKPKSQPKTNTAPPPSANNSFPLKKGSKGEMVKAMQVALITKYGQGILPRYGADGDFGSETAAALAKTGLPASIDEATFNSLVQKKPAASLSPSDIGKLLYAAAIHKDFNKTLALLKTLKSVSDYTAASNAFKVYRIGGVRQTLVNGILNSFPDEKQKQAIKLAFSAMGLKYDGNRWSLSGLGSARILVTTRPTKVWKNPRTAVHVPANMVLGKEIKRRGNFSVFQNDNQFFIVQSTHTKQHN